MGAAPAALAAAQLAKYTAAGAAGTAGAAGAAGAAGTARGAAGTGTTTGGATAAAGGATTGAAVGVGVGVSDASVRCTTPRLIREDLATVAPGETSWVVTCQLDSTKMDLPAAVSVASTFRPRPFSSSVALSSLLPTTSGTVTPDTSPAVSDADGVAAVCADLLPHPVISKPAKMTSASTFFKFPPAGRCPVTVIAASTSEGRQCLRLPTGALEH